MDNDLETFSLLWLDDLVGAIGENISAQGKLRTKIGRLKVFKDPTECERYILHVLKGDRIVLIGSGQLSSDIVPKPQNIEQAISIYIYRHDRMSYESELLTGHSFSILARHDHIPRPDQKMLTCLSLIRFDLVWPAAF